MSVIAHSSYGMQVGIEAGGHFITADEPVEWGGTDVGPNPYDLLLSSLAACTVMTVEMYARRKEWPLEEVSVSLSTHKIHARDCEDCESDPGAKVDIIEKEMTFTGDLSKEQRDRLLYIAGRCPVHRTLEGEIKIRSSRT
jgi:putative redox protein